MSQKVKKAVIAAAGFGTRFLPATKAMPKEMLPLVDKPVIQYVVEDAIAAGIEDIIIVTGWQKRSIEDHFDYPFELEKRLEEAGKHEQVEEVRKIAEMANFIYVRQKGPMGNATPIWNARHVVGNEPFVLLWADDLFDATPSRCQQLVAAYETYGGSGILASMRASTPDDYKRYGYAAGMEIAPGVCKVKDIIEKPGPGRIDSDFAITGGAVYGPEMFDAVGEAMSRVAAESTPREVVYVDAINVLLEQQKDIYALEITNGKFYDCGNKLEYIKAVVEFGLKHEDMREEFETFLKDLPLTGRM